MRPTGIGIEDTVLFDVQTSHLCCANLFCKQMQACCQTITTLCHLYMSQTLTVRHAQQALSYWTTQIGAQCKLDALSLCMHHRGQNSASHQLPQAAFACWSSQDPTKSQCCLVASAQLRFPQAGSPGCLYPTTHSKLAHAKFRL